MNSYQDFGSRFPSGPSGYGNRPFNRNNNAPFQGRGGMGNQQNGYGQYNHSPMANGSHYNNRTNGYPNQGTGNDKPNTYDNRRNHFEGRNGYDQRNNQFGNQGGPPGRNNYGSPGQQFPQRDMRWDSNDYHHSSATAPPPAMDTQQNRVPFEKKSRFEGGNRGGDSAIFGNPPSQYGGPQKNTPPESAAPITSPELITQDDLNHFIQANQVTFKGENIPKPIMSFNAIALPDFIRSAIIRENYVNPTPIQSLTWPIAMEGKNMVGIAQTGSGKTLGFVLPGILRILRARQNSQGNRPVCSPSILVLAPTRELAQQTQEVASKFGGREIRSLCVYGGASRKSQQNRLDSRLDMVIATPGRLNDFLEAGEIELQNCSYLVLDEADRMLDMGFEPQVRRIIKHVRPGSQTLMFSATWPKDVKQLAEEFLGDYAQVSIGSISASPVANHSINQIVEVCQEAEKMDRLFKVLRDLMYEKENKMLIFAATKKKVNQLEREIRGANYPVVAIHGGKPQGERDNALRGFCNGRFQLMVATDVASRGLDVNDIKYVINFDFPTSAEDYIHRIGRTGRCGKSGTSFTFMTSKNAAHAKELVNVLREANQPVPSNLENMARYSKGAHQDFRSRGMKKGFKRERGFNFDNNTSWQEKKFKWERKPRF